MEKKALVAEIGGLYIREYFCRLCTIARARSWKNTPLKCALEGVV